MHVYPPPPEQPFTAHLVELRNRLLRVLAAVVVIFLILMPFANDLYTLLARPLLQVLPSGGTMIATEVISPFLIPFKFAFMVAVFMAMPLALHQTWSFIAPALFQQERRMMIPLLISSILLFYAGMAFAYFVVFPMVFGFMVGAAPAGVAVMTDISKYLDFVMTLFMAFGLTFEVPGVVVLLVKMGWVSVAKLKEIRPYVIVGAFVIGAIFTPPDIISQFMLAMPLWLLYELGIIISGFVGKTATPEDEPYRPLDEAEMEQEFDRMEAAEKHEQDKP